MDASQFPAALRQQAKLLDNYCRNEWPGMSAKVILRFIDGNFRAQGWQGSSFEYWKPNQRGTRVLIRSGALRRSPRQQITPYRVTTVITSKYGAVHNNGFKGLVNVRAHTRKQYTKEKVATGLYTKAGNPRTKTVHRQTGEVNVKAHTMQMNIPRRQFMPNSLGDSPVLYEALKRHTARDFKRFF